MQVMRPGVADKSQLKVIHQDQMVVGEIEDLMRETSCNGFPVVNTSDMFVVGYVTRRDFQMALANARKSYQYVTTNSKVYFSNNVPDFDPTGSSPAPLRLKKIVDLAPMTLSDQTPMEIVIDMFRKLGLRQILITQHGKLQGVITKKDILRFMKEGEF
uniref:CBS domain-containing protein n=1 Tax=Panagrolaimus davidi TaxID=227884 RepID=A0A914PVA3_9BILA